MAKDWWFHWREFLYGLATPPESMNIPSITEVTTKMTSGEDIGYYSKNSVRRSAGDATVGPACAPGRPETPPPAVAHPNNILSGHTPGNCIGHTCPPLEAKVSQAGGLRRTVAASENLNQEHKTKTQELMYMGERIPEGVIETAMGISKGNDVVDLAERLFPLPLSIPSIPTREQKAGVKMTTEQPRYGDPTPDAIDQNILKNIDSLTDTVRRLLNDNTVAIRRLDKMQGELNTCASIQRGIIERVRSLEEHTEAPALKEEDKFDYSIKDSIGRELDLFIRFKGRTVLHSGNNKYYEILHFSWCSDTDTWQISVVEKGNKNYPIVNISLDKACDLLDNGQPRWTIAKSAGSNRIPFSEAVYGKHD